MPALEHNQQLIDAQKMERRQEEEVEGVQSQEEMKEEIEEQMQEENRDQHQTEQYCEELPSGMEQAVSLNDLRKEVDDDVLSPCIRSTPWISR